MSAPFIADSEDLRKIAEFLEGLSELSRKTGCSVVPYGPAQIECPGGATVEIDWDVNAGYRISDQVGS